MTIKQKLLMAVPRGKGGGWNIWGNMVVGVNVLNAHTASE